MIFSKHLKKLCFLLFSLVILLILFFVIIYFSIAINAPFELWKKKAVNVSRKINKTNLPSFYISNRDIAKLKQKKIAPIFELSDDDAKNIYPDYDSDACKATIAVLFGIEDKHYEVAGAYVFALLKAGAKVRFISFENKYVQLADVDGIVITGGNFFIPGEWILNNEEGRYQPPCNRFYINEYLINYALERNMPLLGMCGGMQVMCGILSEGQAKLCNDLKTITDIDHKSQPSKSRAHSVNIKRDSRLYAIFQTDKMDINSRHAVGVMADSLEGTNIEVVAVAPDGIVEVIEVSGYNFAMGIQFHPEILAIEDEAMQNMFTVFIEEAVKYKNRNFNKT